MNKITEEKKDKMYEERLDAMLMARKDTLDFLISNKKWYNKNGFSIAYGSFLAIIECIVTQLDDKEESKRLIQSVLRDGFDKCVILFTKGDLND